MRVLRTFVSYLRAGYLLHIITFIEISCFSFLYDLLNISSWFDNDNHLILKLIAVSPAVGMPLFAQLDARSRYQNYKLVKEHLYVYGFQPRILKPFRKSRCQRDAAIAAASELGLSAPCKNYFKSYGYSWYHLLPDMIFANPEILLTRSFWVTTLFTRTYHPKVDFRKPDFSDLAKKVFEVI
jgi:hypothetical protein